jgi:hypothetical protein
MSEVGYRFQQCCGSCASVRAVHVQPRTQWIVYFCTAHCYVLDSLSQGRLKQHRKIRSGVKPVGVQADASRLLGAIFFHRFNFDDFCRLLGAKFV